MSTAYGGGGGGAGFGGFPYRSAHQQGSDGARGRNRRRRRQYPRKRKKPASLLCAADIVIPADQRVRLIGRGGAVIRQLRETTGATIFVPSQQQNRTSTSAPDKRPVRIKAESVASLLHACWKIVYLGLNIVETAACAKVRIPSNGPNLCGRVARNERFFWATGMEVYCVESFLDAEEVDTIVDNEKFAHSDLVNVQHETVYLQDEHYPSTLVFVYGPQPESLYRTVQETARTMWVKECLSDIVIAENVSPGALTVGTYNVLHPCYAEKYSERAGITKMSHSSNWTTFRAPAIVQLLLESNLDIYLLQEVDMEGLLALSTELTNTYLVVSYVHRLREASDSVAILARKDRFSIDKQTMVPFESKEYSNQHYMCAATALLKDNTTDKTILVASTHFYTKKSLHPESTLLEYLEKQDCDAVLWGGDLNNEYKRSIPNGYSCVEEGHRYTRGEKRIDWIFYSGITARRSEASEAFVNATMRTLEPTGYPPSDHFGEAITLEL